MRGIFVPVLEGVSSFCCIALCLANADSDFEDAASPVLDALLLFTML